jgi:hypothetical protein
MLDIHPTSVDNLNAYHLCCVYKILTNKVKVKQCHYRPWQTLGFQGGWGFQISKQSAHEGGKFVSPKHRPPLPQEIFLVLISVRGWVYPRAIVRPEGFFQWKISMAASGIDTATFRFVTQCLNHCTTACSIHQQGYSQFQK